MKYSIPMVALWVFFGATAAFAVGLTESDYKYLETQAVERTSDVLKNLSPKEQARLHALINDETLKADPAAHAQKINDTLRQFSLNQLWELQNPGQLWDARRK